jgi:hypothetical protein
MVDWGGEHHEPAQIWCFVNLSGIPNMGDPPAVHGNCELTPGVFAVVECASRRTLRIGEPKSRFFEPMVKEMQVSAQGAPRRRKFYLVDTEVM